MKQPGSIQDTHLFDFHVWTTCGSIIPWRSAWSSRKSNMYLIATGSALPRFIVLNITSKKLSTNCWRVPWKEEESWISPWRNKFIRTTIACIDTIHWTGLAYITVYVRQHVRIMTLKSLKPSYFLFFERQIIVAMVTNPTSNDLTKLIRWQNIKNSWILWWPFSL